MAGHQMFHDATVHFTTDYINSLPRKPTYYAKAIKSQFRILLVECEKGGYACSGAIKNLARFIDDFPKLVSDEEKKAVSLLLDHNGKAIVNKSKNEVSIMMSCPLCEFTTKEVTSYRNHIRSHKAKSGDKNQEIMFKCNKCHAKPCETKDLNVYIRHVKTIHSNKKTALCELCGLAFKRADVLQNHKLHVHGPGPKRKHRCEKCSKEFRCKAHLISHYQVHNKQKPYGCEQCDTRFKTEAARDKHIVYKHSNPRSFKCDKCRRGFGTKQNLNQHLAVHEKEILFDAESQARAITQQIALHIQEQFRVEIDATPENGANPESVPTLNSHMAGLSAAPSVVNSPAAHETPSLSESDTHHPVIHSNLPMQSAQGHSSISVAQSSQENIREVNELPITSLAPPPAYPSRPPSVTSQYAGFNEPSHSNEDLDEIFPQSAQDQTEENFSSQYESERNQEALDLVFGQDVCAPDNHQISRPGSVGSHHTEFSDSRSHPAQVIEALIPAVHYMRTVNGDTAVASPQSVCSSQFARHSRPPSVGSQHSNYHDKSAITVPSYHASSYSIPPPEIVFSQSMSRSSNISPNDIQVDLTDLYDKSNSTPPTIQQAMHFAHNHNMVESSHGHAMVTTSHKDMVTPTHKGMATPNVDHMGTQNHEHMVTSNHNRLGTPNQEHIVTPNHNHLGTPNHEHIVTPNHNRLGTPNHEHIVTPNHNRLGTPNHEHIVTPNHNRLGTPNHEHMVTSNHNCLGTPSHEHMVTPSHNHLGTPNHEHMVTPSHNRMGTTNHDHIVTSNHNCLGTPSHEHMVAPSHNHLATPNHEHMVTPSHNRLGTPNHDHIVTSNHNCLGTPSHEHMVAPSHNHLATPNHEHMVTPSHNRLGTPNHDHIVTSNHNCLGTPSHERMVTPNHNRLGTTNHEHMISNRDRMGTPNHGHIIVTSLHSMTTGKDDFSIAKHLINTPASYESHLQPSCFADQFGSSPLYTNTSLSQGCETIDSGTRCVTPQNFPNTHTYNQSSAGVSHRTIDDFGNPIVNTDTLLLPPSNTNDVIPELHTPNKNFADNESVVSQFSNLL